MQPPNKHSIKQHSQSQIACHDFISPLGAFPHPHTRAPYQIQHRHRSKRVELKTPTQMPQGLMSPLLYTCPPNPPYTVCRRESSVPGNSVRICQHRRNDEPESCHASCSSWQLVRKHRILCSLLVSSRPCVICGELPGRQL